jgi:hypothetical protein
MPGSFTSGMCWNNHAEMLSAHRTESTVPMRFHPLRRNRRMDSSLTRRRRDCGEWERRSPNSNLWGFSGFLRGAQGTYGGQGDAPTTRP